jgi:predicted DNA-binding transcriptional regulator YafY
MKADRLLSLLLVLDTRRRVTAAELAQRLEVSQRTIYRDLDALSAAGVPVYAERGNGGGCCLPDGYRVRLNGLTITEAQALALPLPDRVLADLGLRKQASVGLSKLLHALPETVRAQAESAHQRILVDSAGWDAPEEEVQQLRALQEAVWRSERIAMHYRRPNGTAVERVVDPLGLVAKGSIWYLVAAVEGQVRTSRVARIASVHLTGESGARPPDFDLATFWRESSAAFKAAIPRYATRMHVEREAVAGVRSAHRVRVERERSLPDGRFEMEVSFDSESEACAFALSQGSGIDVLEPRELRTRVASQAGAVLRRYASRSKLARHSVRSRRMS